MIEPSMTDDFNHNGISVLNHGFVVLVDHMGNDLSVVRAARVSHDAAWRAGENEGSDARLINYLWRNKHTTPFEAVTFTFEIGAPIFVLRQWHRHRTWSFNELSGRYRELPEEFYVPKPEHIGEQSKDNKQGRSVPGIKREECDTLLSSMIDHSCSCAFEAYRSLINKGAPREIARTVLPLATYSHMFATVNLLNLFKFATLRSSDHAQYEIRVYANAMMELIKPIVPRCHDAWAGVDPPVMVAKPMNELSR
jgi:thymidylate synthase (FAD)